MKRNILLVGISLVLSLTAVFSFYHLLPVFLMDAGFSKSSLGYLYTFFLFTYNAGQLLGGFLLKKISSKSLYTISTLFVTIFLALLYFPFGKTAVVVILFFIYLLWGIQLPPQGVLVHESEDDSAKSFSQVEFFALFGILIGPFAGFWLLKFVSLKGVILFAAVLEMFVTFIRYKVEDEKRYDKTTFKFPKVTRRLVLITVFVSLSFFVFYATSDGPFIPAILKANLGMSLRKISFVFGMATLVSIICIPLFYYLAKKIGMWKVMGISVLIHGTLIYLWSLSYNMLPILVIAFVSVQPVYTYFMPLVMENVGAGERGSVLGLAGFVSGTFGSLSPTLLAGLNNPFIATLFVSVGAVIITLLFSLENKGVVEV